MKKRLAIVCSGVASPLSSAIEFGRRSRDLGYDVHILAPRSSEKLISHANLQYVEIPTPRVNAFAAMLAPDKQNSLNRADRLSEAVGVLAVDDFAESVARLEPDAILIDCELHAHIIFCLSLDVPVAQFSNMFLSPPGSRAPPLHQATTPGVGLRGSRVGVSVAWGAFLLWKLKKVLRARFKYGGADFVSALLELARRHDVPLRERLRLVCWQMPWTYRLPTALLLPKSLDLPTKPRSELAYLGSMVLKDRLAEPHDEGALDRFYQHDREKRLIFVGFGSMMKADDSLLSNIWNVARAHPEWQFLFAAGQNQLSSDTIECPDNVNVVDWAPQLDVLQHVDLAIMHGGTGGFVEAIETGTPVLLYPHVNDQQGSAARAVFHGVGRAGSAADGPRKIEADIQELLQNPEYAERCRKMQASLRQEELTDSVARFLDKVLLGVD